MTPGARTSLVTGAGQTTGRARAEIDLSALRHNVALLRRLASPAALCAVVKADAYGHGASAVARAAVEAGAKWLAVASVEEGVQLRDEGIGAPILVLSEPHPSEMKELVGRHLTATLYSAEGVVAAQRAASEAGRRLDTHIKVDTGMHRVGADPADLASVVSAVDSCEHLSFSALWTHLAVAESTKEEDRDFTLEQLRRFAESRREIEARGLAVPMAHAANSAATICFPESRLDLVRCGIALYGSLPSQALAPVLEAALSRSEEPARADESAEVRELQPVMTLRSEITHTRTLEAGERPSYGRLKALASDSVVATVPVGYADGVPRRYFEQGGTVLIGGRRLALAGAVTMDQIVVDCGPGAPVAVGDDVVLIGEQGGERITAWDWAEVLDTISYEVLARIGPRVKRVPKERADREERRLL